MIEFMLENFINIFKNKNKDKKEKQIIIEEYLLPECVDNLNELARIKNRIFGIEYDIFVVVYSLKPEEFEVGNFYFPFNIIDINFSSYESVEDKIKYSMDKDLVFFRRLYKTFKLINDKKDLNRFTMNDYKELSETLKLACNYFEINTDHLTSM